MFDETTAVDTLLISQVVNYGVYTAAAQVNATFLTFRSCVTGNQYITGRISFQGSGNRRQDSLLIVTNLGRASFEGNARQNNAGASRCYVLAAFRIRAFTNAISINRLAVSRRDQLFVFVIRNTVTISILSYTVNVNRCAGRSIRFAVELVSYTVAISIGQNRIRQLHVAWVAQLAVSVFQRVDPP